MIETIIIGFSKIAFAILCAIVFSYINKIRTMVFKMQLYTIDANRDICNTIHTRIDITDAKILQLEEKVKYMTRILESIDAHTQIKKKALPNNTNQRNSK